MDLQDIRARLRDAPERLDVVDAEGQTLLFQACLLATGNMALPAEPAGDAEHAVVDELLTVGADPSVARADGMAPLHVAAMTGNVRLAEQLIAARAPRSGVLMGASGGSPLALALFYAQTEMARFLADEPVPDNLRLASSIGGSLETHLDAGRPNAKARAGWDFYRPIPAFPEPGPSDDDATVLTDALTYAARHGETARMAELVDAGADVNGNPYRGTPLLWSAFADRVEGMRWLLDHGADPDLAHDFGGAQHGKQGVVMHMAAQFGSVQCLELLLERGADTSIRDGLYGGTPLDWAENAGTTASIEILQRHDA